MPSLKDVAKLAGVSVSTVSAVVNNLDCVRPATRNKVLAAIEEVGYIPNLSARELVTRKKQNIGLIRMVYEQSPTNENCVGGDGAISHAYYEYLNSIAEIFKTSGYGLLIENFSYVPGSESLPKIVEQMRVDGVFVVGSLYTKDFIQLLKTKVNTIVALGCFSELSDFVRSDYTESVAMAMRYLIGHGHRKIAYACGDTATYAYPYKLLGYQMALQEAGISFDPELLCESKFLSSEGYEVAAKIDRLHAEKRPTAVLFASDILAAGGLQYYYQQGIHVPRDLSVMGYENLPFSDVYAPRLTSVDLHKDIMAKEACRIMFHRLKHQDSAPVGVVVPCSIAERDSVGTLPCVRTELDAHPL